MIVLSRPVIITERLDI